MFFRPYGCDRDSISIHQVTTLSETKRGALHCNTSTVYGGESTALIAELSQHRDVAVIA